MKFHRPAAVLVVACALVAGSLAAQEENPKIHGRVVGGIGAPIAGAVVHGPGGTTKTDAAGVFSIPSNPASEDQMLLARADGFALFHRDLAPDAHETEILVRLEPARVVVVRVVGEDGKPMRGVAVHGRIPFAPAYSVLERADFDATTDPEGFAVIRGLAADLAVVAELRPQGMIAAQSPTLAPVPEPSTPDELKALAETITVTPGRSLKIAVETEGGKPVAGAAVLLLPLIEPRLDFAGHASRDTTRGSIRAAQTDAAGTASFDFLPANPLTCEVRAPGLVTQLLVVEGVKAPGKPVRVRLRTDPEPPATDVPWRNSIPAAMSESKKTGRPVFLVMTMDGEKANDWMSGHHYHDREVVRAAREVVPILSSAFGKGGVGESDHDEKDGKCTRYGVIPCHVHQQIERAAREALMETRMHFEVPRHFGRTPAGELLFERVFYLSERDLVRLLVRALRLTDRDAAIRLARERFPSLLEDLGHADLVVRKRGARALALLASSGDEHAAALVQGLASSGLPAQVRADVFAELHPCGLTSPDATFADLVRDPDRDARRALFGRLGEITADEAVLDRLASEIRANDGPVREALLRALDVEVRSGEISVRAPAARNRWRLLEELIEAPEVGRVTGLDDALQDVDRPARHRLLRAVGRRAPADPALQEVLIRAVKGQSPVAALRAIAQAAGPLKPPNPMLRTLIESARAPDAALREEALRAFAASDLPVEPAVLAESLTHPAPAVRIQAALALWRRGDRSGEKILFAAFGDPELGATVRAAVRK